MCIPPGHKKPKRNKIKRGEWRTNDDTLFLTSSNYYLRSKEGLNKFGSDGLIHYKKVFW
ncbi:MAG: hypothetical protein K0S32_2361 [Bacteroidetes bacterium]|nr:hypothetical protein [Bacteroidota bacterium]